MCIEGNLIIETVSELCHIPPETTVKHRRLRGTRRRISMLREVLIGSALVGFDTAGVSTRERNQLFCESLPPLGHLSVFVINVYEAVAESEPSSVRPP